MLGEVGAPARIEVVVLVVAVVDVVVDAVAGGSSPPDCDCDCCDADAGMDASLELPVDADEAPKLGVLALSPLVVEADDGSAGSLRFGLEVEWRIDGMSSDSRALGSSSVV